MTAVALYEIASQYLDDVAKLAELDLPPETIADTLDGMSGALEVKATNVAMFVRSLDVTVAAMKEAEAKMKARREAVEKRQEQITEYLKSNMERCGITKIDGPMLHLAIRTNPPALTIDDPSQVPDEYWIQPAIPDKVIATATLKGVLMGGEEVPGARITRGTRLEIKS